MGVVTERDYALRCSINVICLTKQIGLPNFNYPLLLPITNWSLGCLILIPSFFPWQAGPRSGLIIIYGIFFITS